MFTTIYDLDTWTLWREYAFGPAGGRDLLLFALIAAGCTTYALWQRRPLYLLGVIPVVIFATFWAPVMSREMQWGRALLEQYRAGRCRTAEGRVHVQAEQRLGGHSVDKITVGDVPLQISHFELGPQYRDSIVYGGALKEGVDARVWYCPAAAVFRSDHSGPVVRVDVR
jgi:hypothetical protein